MNRSWLDQGAHDAANPEKRLVATVDDDASVRQLAGMLIPSLGYHGTVLGSLITTRSFGHERGAFTGPLQRPPGHFELATWDALRRRGRVGKRPTEGFKRDPGPLRPAAVRDC